MNEQLQKLWNEVTEEIKAEEATSKRVTRHWKALAIEVIYGLVFFVSLSVLLYLTLLAF